MISEQAYWLALNLIPTIGTMRLKYLIQRFGSAGYAWHASYADLMTSGLSKSNVEQIVQYRQKTHVPSLWEKFQKYNASIITFQDESYPSALRHFDDSPAMLYMRGEFLPQDERAVAIVGTRKPTRYGLDATYYIAKELASQGITIVSGLADGIDTAAHEGALAVGGRTIAIMGNGIDQIYPRSNQTLAQKIIGNGAIMTEFAPETPPHRSNFPRRNRIMSGLSLGVLVAEAPEKSGALITAHVALEQGKDVFVIPANIFNKSGHGSNRLIQDGAMLIMTAQDILENLNISYEKKIINQRAQRVIPDNEIEATLLKHLELDPIHIDDLIRLTGLSTHVVSSTLTVLELKGVAQMVGFMQYCRTTI